MRTPPVAIRIISIVLFAACCAAWAKPFPQLLPPPEDFELSIREDPASMLPPGPGCTGEASATLACRAFIVSVKNVGSHTVHISRIRCQEPVVTFERREPNEIQTPIEVVSKAIDETSPALRDLGPFKIAVSASVSPKEQADATRKRIGARCAGDKSTSVECTVFRLTIQNDGDRPIRIARYTCSDSSIQPEVRGTDGEWSTLPLSQQPWNCTANIYFETPILPGKAIDRDFLLWRIAPRFDTSKLYPAGDYTLRFRFVTDPNDAHFCFASTDGTFSLQCPEEKLQFLTNEVVVHASAYVPVPSGTDSAMRGKP